MMRIGTLHHLAVLALLAVFGVVLPTHRHGPAAWADGAVITTQDTGLYQPASHDDQPASSHNHHDCPTCRTATGLTSASPQPISLAPPARHFARTADDQQPPSVLTYLPFNSRAPPAD